jgi:transposase InsO family protein
VNVISGASFLGCSKTQKGWPLMFVDDAVSDYRKRLVAVIERSPNVRAACREAGIHHSTFYRWRNRQNRPPVAVVSWTESFLHRQIVATALAYPDAGPQHVADLLGQGDIVVSASKVWRTLKKHRLNTRALRYALLRVHRDGVPHLSQRRHVYVGELDADVPGDLVQMDCFRVGSFKETRLKEGKQHHGVIWQYTAIDVASSYVWAELHATKTNPDPAITSALAHQVAADLTSWGWDLKAVSTDNGNEFRARLYRDTLESLDIKHRFIRAGRPQSNGKVERVQGTISQECYQPALIGYVTPSITGLRRDLDNYLNYYNYRRPHRGKWNQGKPPTQIIHPNQKLIK